MTSRSSLTVTSNEMGTKKQSVCSRLTSCGDGGCHQGSCDSQFGGKWPDPGTLHRTVCVQGKHAVLLLHSSLGAGKPGDTRGTRCHRHAWRHTGIFLDLFPRFVQNCLNSLFGNAPWARFQGWEHARTPQLRARPTPCLDVISVHRRWHSLLPRRN